MPMEEERRLFYVGITRAMDLLFITYAASRMSYGRYQSAAPSRFLASLPESSVRTLSRSGRRTETSLSERARDRNRMSTWSQELAPTPSQPPAPVVIPDFKVGQRVFHSKFGEGTISKVQARRDDQELGVEFTRHGHKLLMASLANLDLIE